MPRKYTSTAHVAADRARRRKEAAALVKHTLIAVLRRGSIVDTDDPALLELYCAEQERIAKRLQSQLDAVAA